MCDLRIIRGGGTCTASQSDLGKAAATGKRCCVLRDTDGVTRDRFDEVWRAGLAAASCLGADLGLPTGDCRVQRTCLPHSFGHANSKPPSGRSAWRTSTLLGTARWPGPSSTPS
jgi:hypothetical protein